MLRPQPRLIQTFLNCVRVRFRVRKSQQLVFQSFERFPSTVTKTVSVLDEMGTVESNHCFYMLNFVVLRCRKGVTGVLG